MEMVMGWEQRMADAGCRVTVPRRAVVRVLEEACAPLPPQQVWEAGQRIHPDLGLVTVYRTLALLTELDLVRRVHRQDGCHGYVMASPGHRHHIVCQHCGGVVEFPGGDDIASLVERVEGRTGYRVEDHLLQLFGLCPACQGGG
jgi:Fe2+ or Zn2+ uptake regulation protein